MAIAPPGNSDMVMKKRLLIIAVLVMVGCSHNTSIDIDMVLIQGGEFMMGSEKEEADDDERPLHWVSVNSFYMARYEVTQELWSQIMNGKNPSVFKGEKHPVECVSWYDVQIFIERLNKISGRKFRLPTEIEWEYAAKGGAKRIQDSFNGIEPEFAGWIADNSGGMTHDVGQLEPNELGLYDMCGNVHEWCYDLYDSLSYSRQQTIVQQKIAPHEIRVYRGGSWCSSKRYCRPANRNKNIAGIRNFSIGFRLAEDIVSNP